MNIKVRIFLLVIWLSGPARTEIFQSDYHVLPDRVGYSGIVVGNSGTGAFIESRDGSFYVSVFDASGAVVESQQIAGKVEAVRVNDSRDALLIAAKDTESGSGFVVVAAGRSPLRIVRERGRSIDFLDYDHASQQGVVWAVDPGSGEYDVGVWDRSGGIKWIDSGLRARRGVGGPFASIAGGDVSLCGAWKDGRPHQLVRRQGGLVGKLPGPVASKCPLSNGQVHALGHDHVLRTYDLDRGGDAPVAEQANISDVQIGVDGKLVTRHQGASSASSRGLAQMPAVRTGGSGLTIDGRAAQGVPVELNRDFAIAFENAARLGDREFVAVFEEYGLLAHFRNATLYWYRWAPDLAFSADMKTVAQVSNNHVVLTKAPRRSVSPKVAEQHIRSLWKEMTRQP